MSRKTVNVLVLLEYANKNLKRNDEYATVDYKCGICSMIEMVLHETDNYAGFGFQDNSDIQCGTLGYYSRTYYYSAKMRIEVAGHLNAVNRHGVVQTTSRQSII